ncbi:Uncharacterized protein BM_BM16918 [Brugia malayi]|uniref:Bm16918 n=1 Tax=Brugia malayi TaxID=6279 RepID=A0A0H5S9X1_BRUMA|nr:Uncharacterized protein BM_BM16918 [Brugia malayi]CRZ25473.1 Bm16918 [Brugia malayi]VIO99674.1 Uncharacterized protein BM_BM16918 [Brugia malayi]
MRKNSEKMVQVGCEEGEKCTSRISSVLQFPHAHQSYKCICGLIHVKPATRTIGAVTVFLISMNFFWVILTYSDTKDVSVGSAVLYSTYVLAVIVSTFALFLGVSRKRSTKRVINMLSGCSYFTVSMVNSYSVHVLSIFR